MSDDRSEPQPGELPTRPWSRREVLEWLKVAAYSLPVVGYLFAPGCDTGPSQNTTDQFDGVTPPSDTAGPSDPTPPSDPSPSTDVPNTDTANPPTPTTSVYNCQFTRASQSGGCNFQPQFSGALRCTRSGNSLAIVVDENADRGYLGSITGDAFNCSGANQFGSCSTTADSTCSGRFTNNFNSVQGRETLNLTGCCSGRVEYDFTGTLSQ